MFSQAHDAFWTMCRDRLGDAAGTRALIEVLLLHRHLPADDIITGMTVALRLQSPSPDLVAVEARKASSQDSSTAGSRENNPLSLALKRRDPIRDQTTPIVVLPSDPRPLPTVHQYDQLLTRRFAAMSGEMAAEAVDGVAG
jgi:hypothetical protein